MMQTRAVISVEPSVQYHMAPACVIDTHTDLLCVANKTLCNIFYVCGTSQQHLLEPLHTQSLSIHAFVNDTCCT